MARITKLRVMDDSKSWSESYPIGGSSDDILVQVNGITRTLTDVLGVKEKSEYQSANIADLLEDAVSTTEAKKDTSIMSDVKVDEAVIADPSYKIVEIHMIEDGDNIKDCAGKYNASVTSLDNRLRNIGRRASTGYNMNNVAKPAGEFNGPSFTLPEGKYLFLAWMKVNPGSDTAMQFAISYPSNTGINTSIGLNNYVRGNATNGGGLEIVLYLDLSTEQTFYPKFWLERGANVTSFGYPIKIGEREY